MKKVKKAVTELWMIMDMDLQMKCKFEIPGARGLCMLKDPIVMEKYLAKFYKSPLMLGNI